MTSLFGHARSGTSVDRLAVELEVEIVIRCLFEPVRSGLALLPKQKFSEA